MGGYPQHNAFFSLDNAAGSPTDYSASIIEFSLAIKLNTGGFFTFGTRGEQQNTGGYTGSLDVKIKGDITATALVSVLNTYGLHGTLATYNASKSFVCSYPDNATAGSHRASGECKLDDLGKIVMGSAGKGDVQAQDVKFKTDGDVVYAVI